MLSNIFNRKADLIMQPPYLVAIVLSLYLGMKVSILRLICWHVVASLLLQMWQLSGWYPGEGERFAVPYLVIVLWLEYGWATVQPVPRGG